MGFPRPAATLVGEAPPLDAQGERARDLGDHLEVGVAQSAGTRGGERDGAEHGAGRQRHQRQRPVAAVGEHAPARLRRIVVLEIVDAYGSAGGHHALQQGSLEGCPGPGGRRSPKRAGRQVEALEGAALGVEQRHADRVEPHQPRDAIGERGEHLLERVRRRQQGHEPVDDLGAPCQPLEIAPAVDGRAQLAGKARRQGRGRQLPHAAEKGQLANPPASRIERRPQESRRPAPGGARAGDAVTSVSHRRSRSGALLPRATTMGAWSCGRSATTPAVEPVTATSRRRASRSPSVTDGAAEIGASSSRDACPLFMRV